MSRFLATGVIMNALACSVAAQDSVARLQVNIPPVFFLTIHCTLEACLLPQLRFTGRQPNCFNGHQDGTTAVILRLGTVFLLYAADGPSSDPLSSLHG